MSNPVKLDEFKQQVADCYSQRSNTYDDGDFHPKLAHHLIEYAAIHRGQKILDIATGTGLVAIEAAQLVGSEGQVIGVDISTGLLEQAKRKVKAADLSNRVAQRYGVELVMSDLTGTEDKCYTLLREAGFEDIEVKTEQFGSYISLDEVKGMWNGSLRHPLCRPRLKLDTEQLEQAKAEYEAELEALVTDKGIWNDITTFFVLGRKG